MFDECNDMNREIRKTAQELAQESQIPSSWIRRVASGRGFFDHVEFLTVHANAVTDAAHAGDVVLAAALNRVRN